MRFSKTEGAQSPVQLETVCLYFTLSKSKREPLIYASGGRAMVPAGSQNSHQHPATRTSTHRTPWPHHGHDSKQVGDNTRALASPQAYCIKDSLSVLVGIQVITSWSRKSKSKNHLGIRVVSKFSPEIRIQIIWKRICLSLCDSKRLFGLAKYFQRPNSCHGFRRGMSHASS